MALDRLDASSSPTGIAGPVSRGADPIGPAGGDPRVDAPFGVGGVAPATARRSAPDLEGVDPVEEVVALTEGRAVAGPAGGLAAQLLDYVTPRPRNADALQQPRILPLLGVAADHLGAVAGRSDLLDSLGIKALRQELDHHRALAERRSNRLEP